MFKNFSLPSQCFFAIVVIGALLRIAASLSGLAIVYPDEHFQTLEPASWIVYGFGWKSWEWYHGTRSWFVPGLYLPLLYVLKSFAVQGGPAAIYACRVFTACCGGWMLWRFHRLLVLREVHRWAHIVVLAALSCSTAMVVWSATTFSDTWALCFLWLAMPELAAMAVPSAKRRAFLAGILFGLSLLARLQMLLWALPLFLYLALHTESRKNLRGFSLGYGTAVLCLGVLDWLSWGKPFQSAYKNIEFNIFQRVADTNGTSPWYEYFFLLPENLGWPLSGLLLAAVVLGLCSRLRLTRMDGVILWPALFFLSVHMAIAHKELRFLLPAFPALFYAAALGLDAFFRRRPSFTGPVAAFFLALFISTQVSSDFSPARRSAWDLSEAQSIVLADDAFKAVAQPCIVFVDSYWVWGRGDMLFGRTTEHREAPSTNLSAEWLQACHYAIVAGASAATFQAQASAVGAIWRELGRDRHSAVVFKHVF